MRAYHTEYYYAEVVVQLKIYLQRISKSRTKHLTFCVKVDISQPLH